MDQSTDSRFVPSQYTTQRKGFKLVGLKLLHASEELLAQHCKDLPAYCYATPASSIRQYNQVDHTTLVHCTDAPPHPIPCTPQTATWPSAPSSPGWSST